MKKYLLAALAAVVCLSASAQPMLRHNYKKNNYVYTAAERVRVEGSTPLVLKLERISFPDGGDLYRLRIDFEESSAWKMPKNAPLTINTASGKTVILRNEGDSPNLVAPSGIKTSSGKVYWNYGEYYLEKADLDKLLGGVRDIDATKRWAEGGTIKVSYKNNEFATALKRQADAIASAPKPKEDIGSELRSISDQRGNRLVETNTLRVNGQLSVSLVYLYYAETNSENYDLNLYVPGTTVPIGGQVTIVASDGEQIVLSQEKELSAGRVICYPSTDQLKKMARGVSRISVSTVGSPVNISISDGSFGAAIDKLYNSLQTASIL